MPARGPAGSPGDRLQGRSLAWPPLLQVTWRASGPLQKRARARDDLRNAPSCARAALASPLLYCASLAPRHTSPRPRPLTLALSPSLSPRPLSSPSPSPRRRLRLASCPRPRLLPSPIGSPCPRTRRAGGMSLEAGVGGLGLGLAHPRRPGVVSPCLCVARVVLPKVCAHRSGRSNLGQHS